jgi:hypothetical protein
VGLAALIENRQVKKSSVPFPELLFQWCFPRCTAREK